MWVVKGSKTICMIHNLMKHSDYCHVVYYKCAFIRKEATSDRSQSHISLSLIMFLQHLAPSCSCEQDTWNILKDIWYIDIWKILLLSAILTWVTGSPTESTQHGVSRLFETEYFLSSLSKEIANRLTFTMENLQAKVKHLSVTYARDSRNIFLPISQLVRKWHMAEWSRKVQQRLIIEPQHNWTTEDAVTTQMCPKIKVRVGKKKNMHLVCYD